MRKKAIQSLIATINIDELEKSLPPKKTRSNHVLVKADKISKSFGKGRNIKKVLHDVSINLYAGEFVIISGASGSGKSTLLHSLLGLEEPTHGQVYIRDEALYKMDQTQRTNWRREKMGIVFQQSNWIRSLSVWENVAYPLWLENVSLKEAKERAVAALTEVGLEKELNQTPTELSGGQQQRASLARVLVADPGIIFADEPTGNLDSASSRVVIEILAKLNRIERKLIIMVTHDTVFLPIATRTLFIKDGRLIGDVRA